MIYRFFSIAIVAMLLVSSCEKIEPAEPPANTIPNGHKYTLSDIRQLYYDSVKNACREYYKFTDDYSVYVTVTMDDKAGNIYKSAYVQDSTGAINLHLLSSGGVTQGDYIRLSLKGTVLSAYRGMLQIDSVDAKKNIVVQSSCNDITPKIVHIADLDSSYQGMLIQLDSVEFKDTNVTYADAQAQSTLNRTLKDCYHHSIYVRTSGYADFADEKTPVGFGSIVAIVGQYDSDMQLYIRTPKEVIMNNPYCFDGYYIDKDFEDKSLKSGGWTTQKIVGTLDWTLGTHGGNYAQMSNYNRGNSKSETWFISPVLDVADVENLSFSFDNACNFNGDDITVWVSTNYDGVSNPDSVGTWTQLSATLSSGNWEWVNSGTIDLSAYCSHTTYVAFKYTGSDSDGKTWEIDNIVVKKQ
jgi:hypothetical protein